MKKISQNDPRTISVALDYLQQKKPIIFACDTVYGIAVDATCELCVDNLYRIKKREKNKPIAIFLPEINIAREIFFFDKLAEKIATKFLSKGLTMVLKKRPDLKFNLAKNLNENDDGFLGFRIIENDFINEILQKFGGILAVTSANISGNESAICADDVEKNFANSKEDFLLIDGGICQAKIASTVVKIEHEKLQILREGAVKKWQLSLE